MRSLVGASTDRQVVLLGLGHTNIQVLRKWRRHRIPGVRLTCITNHAVATYSGMLPAVLAGMHPRERMEIDLARLCAASGAQLLITEVTGLEAQSRSLIMRDHPPLAFDVLSIGIGSVPSFDGVDVSAGSELVPIKPMQTFLARLDSAMRSAAHDRAGMPIRATIVGGGAAGAEIAFALPGYLAQFLGKTPSLDETILSTDQRLVSGGAEATSRRVMRELSRRGVRTVLGRRVVRVAPRQLVLDDGAAIDADVILRATGAAPPPLVGLLGLPTDERGFLLTRDTLQSTSRLPVFVVGDTGTIEGTPLPKAGVFAVRQGPVLWDNIARCLAGRPLRPTCPSGAS